jgi:hypothetical protein
MNTPYGPSSWPFMADSILIIAHIPPKHFSDYIAADRQKTLHGLLIPLT